MSNQVDLLRMLEPVVRPGHVSGSNRPVNTPIEQRDFESLLAEANGRKPDGEEESSERVEVAGTRDEPDGPLRELRQVGLIENESLRQLLSAAGHETN